MGFYINFWLVFIKLYTKVLISRFHILMKQIERQKYQSMFIETVIVSFLSVVNSPVILDFCHLQHWFHKMTML